VSHPDFRRFFISIEDAARFILEATTFSEPAETVVPLMGSEVSILSVAEGIANQYVPRPRVVISGLKPGEKLREVLVGANEGPTQSRGNGGALAIRQEPLRTSLVREAVVNEHNVTSVLKKLACNREGGLDD
jgi:FlaA1/EpsC-like NDP-sugar epimerase